MISLYFNSHFPRGERPDAIGGVINIITFQFTLPAWGAIVLAGFFVVFLVISILALAWRVTCIAGRIVLLSYVFNSCSPHGERPELETDDFIALDFNSRSLPGERLLGTAVDELINVFQFTLPAWGATVPHM